MANYIWCIVMITAVTAAHRHHFKFPKPEDNIIPLLRTKGEYEKVACTDDIAKKRNDVIEQSKCGKPRDVFVHLDPKVGYEQVSPRAVWVKRCVGLCDFDNAGCCVATKSVIRHIPIRIYDANTKKETCGTYPVEEHVSCNCCHVSPDTCASPRVYNPRKCSCQCPNLEDRRNCFNKRAPNVRWNRVKCVCEER